MEVRVHEDLREFWQIASPLYLADPVRHTLALTVTRRLLETSDPADLPPVLLTMWDGARFAGATFRTPPWPVSVSGLPESEIESATTTLLEVDPELPGVAGPRDIAEPFAEAWAKLTGTTINEVMAGRLYRLTRLESPVVPGRARLASTDDDVMVMAGFRTDFQLEAMGHVRVPGVAVSDVRRSLAMGNAHILWEVDGRVVSYAAVGKPINGMSRVGPVYTPPGERGHGYGSAVTAAVSQWALDAGGGERPAVHRPGEPHLELGLPANRLPPGVRLHRAGIPEVISEPWHLLDSWSFSPTSSTHPRGWPTG